MRTSYSFWMLTHDLVLGLLLLVNLLSCGSGKEKSGKYDAGSAGMSNQQMNRHGCLTSVFSSLFFWSNQKNVMVYMQIREQLFLLSSSSYLRQLTKRFQYNQKGFGPNFLSGRILNPNPCTFPFLPFQVIINLVAYFRSKNPV